MHVSSWLQAAVLPDRWRVADIKCFPLSVWHHFALEELRNAYAFEVAKEPDMDAAAELLMICSRSHALGKVLFTSDQVMASAVVEIGQLVKYQNPNEVHLAVLDYWHICTRTPGHKKPPVKLVQGQRLEQACDRKYIVAPQEWVMVEFFSRGDPARHAAAWDMPYATARCLYDAHRNAVGDDESLESRTDEARTDAWLERERREAMKAGAA